MKISVGCDHRGIEVKNWVLAALTELNIEAVDCGANSPDSCDYPDVAEKVARLVSEQEVDLGLLICGSGIGMSIAANKLAGVRAALCIDQANARLARQHNHANVVCLAANGATQDSVKSIVETFVQTDFEGGRHARRVNKINELDKSSVANQN